MTTLCRAYRSEQDARAAVDRLLSAGLRGSDVRVLMGEPIHDAHEQAVGGFAGEAGRPVDAVGTFAGASVTHRAGMGGFAGEADRMRGGGFGDTDRDTVTSYPDGVGRTRITAHRGLKKLLLEAGLDEPSAEADVRALHEGRVLVLVQTSALPADEAARVLDAPAAA